MDSERPAKRSRLRAARIGVATLAAFLATLSDASADEVCTSFELQPTGICMTESVFRTVPPGDFTIGTSPITATFSDGDVMILGIGEYYRSGTHSWHVGPGVTAIIFFETPASAIELFFRNAVGGGPSVVRVINTDDVVILTAPGIISQFFGQVGVNNLPPGPMIDRIEVENNSAVADVVVDDVAFVPEPLAELPAATALLALLAVGRGKRRISAPSQDGLSPCLSP